MISAKWFNIICSDKAQDIIIRILLKNDEIFFRLKNVDYTPMGHDVLYIEDNFVLNEYLINMEDVQCIIFGGDAELKRKIREAQKNAQNSIMENKKEDKIKMSV